MNSYKETIWLGIFFMLLSAIMYYIHYLFFHKASYIFDSLLLQLAFLPIYVFLITLIIERLISLREKRLLLRKLNMVIGAFYSEVGQQLLSLMTDYHSKKGLLQQDLKLQENWADSDFAKAKKAVLDIDFDIDHQKHDLTELRLFLIKKRDFLLLLLQNPNLLEHENFTNLLWAVFHLAEELSGRTEIVAISRSDFNHLATDIKRVYSHLIIEWLSYMEHLQQDYPYLFSLEVRINPFNPDTSVEFH